MTSRMLGDDSEVVIVNNGYMQTIVSPVAKSRQEYWAGPADAPDSDEWVKQAEQHTGSWHWIHRLTPRSGEEKPAPPRSTA